MTLLQLYGLFLKRDIVKRHCTSGHEYIRTLYIHITNNKSFKLNVHRSIFLNVMNFLIWSTYMFPFRDTEYPIRILAIFSNAIKFIWVSPVFCEILFCERQKSVKHKNNKKSKRHTKFQFFFLLTKFFTENLNVITIYHDPNSVYLS